jgi:hypothetical protein
VLGTLEVFHVGVVVEDIDDAMATIGANLGIRWAPVLARGQAVRTGGGETRIEELRFTYSADGPPHVELIEAWPGSVWGAPQPHVLHHIGAFSDDIATPPGEGLLLEFGGGHDEAPSGFAYYTAPGGIRVELVDASRRADFDRWFAGGELAAAASRRA